MEHSLDLKLDEEVILKDGRDATVRFIGPLHWEAYGVWLGVELKTGTGDHDGKVDGQRYFYCMGGEKRGLFVTRSMVERKRQKKRSGEGEGYKSKGRARRGMNNSSMGRSNSMDNIYEVTFSSRPLGFSLYSDDKRNGKFKSSLVVRDVFNQSGQGPEIMEGDYLYSINSAPIHNMDIRSILALIKNYAFHQPLTLGFKRGKKSQSILNRKIGVADRSSRPAQNQHQRIQSERISSRSSPLQRQHSNPRHSPRKKIGPKPESDPSILDIDSSPHQTPERQHSRMGSRMRYEQPQPPTVHTRMSSRQQQESFDYNNNNKKKDYMKKNILSSSGNNSDADNNKKSPPSPKKQQQQQQNYPPVNNPPPYSNSNKVKKKNKQNNTSTTIMNNRSSQPLLQPKIQQSKLSKPHVAIRKDKRFLSKMEPEVPAERIAPAESPQLEPMSEPILARPSKSSLLQAGHDRFSSITMSQSVGRSQSFEPSGRRKRKQIGRLHRGTVVLLKDGGLGVVRNVEQAEGEGGTDQINIELSMTCSAGESGTMMAIEKEEILKILYPEELMKLTLRLSSTINSHEKIIFSQNSKIKKMDENLQILKKSNEESMQKNNHFFDQLGRRVENLNSSIQDTQESLSNGHDVSSPELYEGQLQIWGNQLKLLKGDCVKCVNGISQYRQLITKDAQDLEKNLSPDAEPASVADIENFFETNLKHGWYVTPKQFIDQCGEQSVSHAQVHNIFRKFEKHYKKLKFYSGHTDIVYTVDCRSKDDLICTGSDEQAIRFWRIIDSHLECIKVETQAYSVNKLTFSPDGKWLAVATSGCTVELWNVGTLTKEIEYHSRRKEVWALCFSPDSKLLATGNLGAQVELFDIKTAHPIQTLIGHTEWVNEVCFSPDGSFMASCSGDTTVRIWKDAACQAILQGHKHFVRCVAFSHVGFTIISCSDDKTIRFWNFSDLGNTHCYRVLKGHSAGISSVSISQSGLFVSSGKDGVLKLWNLETGFCLASNKSHEGDVNDAKFSSNGKHIISVSDDYQVKLWDIQTYINS